MTAGPATGGADSHGNLSGPLVVLGATSGIGRLTMDEALRRGHAVRAFARGADALPARDGLDRVAGDARRTADLDAALAGAGAVVYALGVRERLAMLWQPETLFSETTAALIDRMQAAGVARLVAVTGFGAGRSRAAMGALQRLGHDAVLGRVYADKSRQEALIMDSTLDWTIARPVILTNRPASGQVHAVTDPARWRNGLVSRADVAAYLVDAVERGLNLREDPVILR